MRRAAVTAMLVVLGAALPAAAVETVPGPDVAGAKCYHSSWFHHDPPLTMDPDSGEMKSAEPGVLECYGVIDGVAVAGVGSYTWKGTFGVGTPSDQLGGGNCFVGSGHGTFKGRIPRVDGGFLHVRGEFNFIRGVHGGPEWGNVNGIPYTGVLRGDTPDVLGHECSEVPITRSNLYSDFVLGGAAT